MVSPDDTGRVVGELYEIDRTDWDNVIARLDEYEGCSSDDPPPHEYRREVINARLANGATVPAWSYVLNSWPEPRQEIASGDYLSWRAANVANSTSGLTPHSTRASR